jgi:hypothetical protein
MSLEWARARALQNEARLRELAKSGERKEWTEVTLVAPARVTVWVEPRRARHEAPARLTASDGRRAIVRIDGELLHKSINRDNFHE